MHTRLTKRLDEAREGGFTLIELLIVIVVLGILAAIVVFAIGQTRGDAVGSSCVTNAKQVQLSQDAVKTKTGSYATASADLLGSGTKGGLLKAMPITTKDYTITWTSGTADAYAVTIAKTSTGDIAGGTVTQATTDAELEGYCKK